MDWNNDGYKDIIVGHYGVKTGTPTGKVHWFKRNSNGTLQASELLKYGNSEITARYTAPCVVDWNNDGLLDLIVGTSDDSVNGVHMYSPMIFINEGSKEQYLFTEKNYLKTSNGSYIEDYRYGRVHPKVTDLNNDGKKDLILNGWGYGDNGERFYFYENIGTDAAPVLDTKFQLKEHDGSTSFTTMKNYCNGRFDIFDWNQDGYEDIIWVDYRQNYANPIFISLSSTDGPLPDNTPPSLTLNNPSKDTTIKINSITLTGSANDASGIKTVKVNGTEANYTRGTWSYYATGLNEGTNTFIITAEDENSNFSKDTLIITYDNPVSISLTSFNLSNININQKNSMIHFSDITRKFNFNLISINGKVVLKGKLIPNRNMIMSLNNLSQGTYLLNLSDLEGNQINHKIMVIK